MVKVRTRPEHPATGAALAVVGGFLDAYTYVAHQGVFANAQTGNVVFVAIDLAQGRWGAAARYLPIIAAFVVGLVVAEVVAAHRHRRLLSDPTRVVLVAEILALAAVAAVPTSTPHLVATLSVAFVAALQVTTFRLVRETSYSTTMTTGNLRSLVTATYEWLSGYDRSQRTVAARLALIVLSFTAGAALGALVSRPDVLGTHAPVVVVAILLVVLASIETHTRRTRDLRGARAERAVPSAPELVVVGD